MSKQKSKRTLTVIQRYGYLFTLLVAFGGLWYPRLGLLVILVMAGLTGMSLFRGRYWCGHYCAHGSLFDQVVAPFSRNGRIPGLLRARLTQVVIFLFFMYNFANRLYATFAQWGNLQFVDRLGFVFVTTYLVVTVVGSLMGVLFAPRTWCHVCPMGMMQSLTYRLGKLAKLTSQEPKVTMHTPEKCVQCGKCARVCPMQLSPFDNLSAQNTFDDETCIRCGICVENCPLKLLSLSRPGEAKERISRAGN